MFIYVHTPRMIQKTLTFLLTVCLLCATQTLLAQEKKSNEVNTCAQKNVSDIWIDRLRSSTYTGACNTVRWVDSLFGDEHEFDGQNFTGKVTLGFREDEIEGFKPKLRVKVKAKLPNASKKLNAFIGRVEEDSYISNTEVRDGGFTNEGLRSTNDGEDDEWLIGLGYKDPSKNNNGFDYSLGIKLSGGINPYAKVTHRYLFEFSDRHFWKTTQTGFWRRDERFGVSSRLDYTMIINQDNIFEWDTTAKYTEEFRDIEWITSASWHHSLSDKKGISSQLYVRNDKRQNHNSPEFGFNLTHIRPFLRPWMFIEASAGVRWMKNESQSQYKSAARVNLQFTMKLGNYKN